MGHEMFFSPIKLGSEQIRPLNGRFFCFHDCWKKSMQNLKELHHHWLLQIFINGHFNFCSKSWMFFFFSGSRDEPDGSQRRKSNIYVI